MIYLSRKALLITSIIIFVIHLAPIKAQVTIGADTAPQEGVLLDLKEYNDATAQSGGRTTTKGLLLPRLTLTTLNSLTDVPSANQTTPLQYRGLTVYNSDNTHESTGLYQGINVWDGAKWNSIRSNIASSAPKSFVRATGGASLSLVDISLLTGWKKLIFTVEEFDENVEYDNTTTATGGQFIPKQGGIYVIYAQYSVSSLLTASEIGVGIFRKPAGGSSFSLVANGTSLSVGALGGTITRNIQTMIKLNANDVIIIGSYSLVTLTLIGNSNSYVTIQQVK